MYFLLHQLQNLFQEEHLKEQPQVAQVAQVAQEDQWVLMQVHLEEHLLQDYLITYQIIY